MIKQSSVHLGKKFTFNSVQTHVDVLYCWIREIFEDKVLQLKKLHTNENWSDIINNQSYIDKEVPKLFQSVVIFP